MTLLTYFSKYIVQSVNSVQTNSTTLQIDTEATQNFNLASSKVALILYEAHASKGDDVPTHGLVSAISVDGSNECRSCDSGSGADRPVRNFCFWIGTLASGDHTIQGKLATGDSGSNVTVSYRTLIIMLFDGDEWDYIENNIAISADGVAFEDDPFCEAVFTPSGSCKVLAFYNNNSEKASGSAEAAGKLAINIGGADYNPTGKSSYTANDPSSKTNFYIGTLATSLTTLKGRFARNAAVSAYYLNNSRLGYLLLSDDTLIDFSEDATQASVGSDTFIDDPHALIERDTATPTVLLALATCFEHYGTSSSAYGGCYGIYLGSDVAESKTCADNTYADGATVAWIESLAAASYSIKGRLKGCFGAYGFKVDERAIGALWFEDGEPPAAAAGTSVVGKLIGAGVI